MATDLLLIVAALSMGGGLTGCRTAPAFSAADISTPGWQVKQGQAVWKPNRNRPEMTGELFLAFHASGDCLVQFTKPPFSIVEVRAAGERWQVDFGSGQRVWHGNGRPPARIMWFQLAQAQLRQGPDPGWSWRQAADGGWILSNARTGEVLQGRFFE